MRREFSRPYSCYLQPDVFCSIALPDGDTFESAFVKLRLLSIGSRVLARSLWQDEETQIIAQGYGAVELVDKGRLFNELILQFNA